nr:metallopeptidase TldD-related protein [Pacificimonas pallii]
MKRAGASHADAVYVGGDSASVSVRLGNVEDISRSEDAEIGIRAFAGDRSASVALSDFAPAAIAEAARRAVAMARLATPDEHAGLVPEEMLAKTALPDLQTDDGGTVDLTALEANALQCEDAARAVHGVTNSGGGGASASRGTFALATSHGFAAARTGTSYSVYASVIAGEGENMQRDYASHSARHLADLEDVSEVGSRAGTRTVARLNPVKPKSGVMTVLFDPRVSPGIVGHLIGAINGGAIARGTSFLTEPDAQVFGAGVAILEDPHRARGHRSRAFDGEGIATTRRSIVEDGRLTGWLLNNAAARQLGLATTGHAARGTGGPPGIGPSNLHMAAGTQSREDMIAAIGSGILITELIGQGVSIVTGDYSRGAGGFLIENGEITRPVSGITIAGNLKDMFARLIPASDLEFRHATNAPTLLVEGMTVAGE